MGLKRNRCRYPWFLIGASLAGLAFLSAPAAGASSEQVEFFEGKVRPLLADHCYACHSDRTETPFGGLRLDSREAAVQGGDSGSALVPGKPGQSRLIAMLRGKPLLMPPTGRLSDEQIAFVSEWIRVGAPWPEEPEASPSPSDAFDLEARKAAHWAWHPVQQGNPPEVHEEDWPANPVDRFLLHKLEQAGLRPADPADRRTLIRRVSFDLTGLPPTPGEIDAFVTDDSRGAYRQLVRRLLSSDRFGERWARHWMDWVRYADSHGSEGDPSVPEAWQYRDYLIRALNADTPYDQLVKEHLAGDLIERPRIGVGGTVNESILGTAHLRLGELGYQPVDPWEERVKWTDNQIDVFSKAFQGLTVACARCHDHKFDAISQADYYALFGVLYGARPTMRTIDSPKALRLHKDAMGDLKAEVRKAAATEWIAVGETMAARLQAATDDTVGRAIEEAACDESSPLNPWLGMRDMEATEFRDSWKRLQDDWRQEIAVRKAFNERHFERLWDLSGEDYAQWVSHGTGASYKPSSPGEFAILHEGEQAFAGIYPGGAYTHLLSTKHAGVMQSPRFEVDTDHISVKVLGGNLSFARLMIENYPLPGGGIYHQRFSPRSDTMQWWTWDTSFWKGFTAYVEFATLDDATNFRHDPVDSAKSKRPERPTDGRSAIGAAAVAFHDGKDEPKETVEPILFLLEGSAPESPAALPTFIASKLVLAASAWRDGRITEKQGAFLDYFVRRGLLPTSLESLERVRPLVAEYRRLEGEITIPRRFPGVVEEGAPDQPLLIRGDPQKPGETVPRRQLSAVGGTTYANPATVRLQLADEVASPSNPLTARVMANRVWQQVFGRGIVATPDNFGFLGERPSHPELLDYIASRFVENGWSIKGLVEMLVTTRAYRMSSVASAQALQTDPANALLQHMPVRRLEAEAIRDSLLAISGKLDRTMFGAKAPIRDMYAPEKSAETLVHGDDRRGVYQEIRRNRRDPFLEIFDQPMPSTTRGRRDVTNVPAQALALMNSPFVIGAAREWGRRLAGGEGHTLESRVDYMFAKALGRSPTPAQRESMLTFISGLAEEETAASHEVLGNPEVWSRLAHTLFNFKEFLYVR